MCKRMMPHFQMAATQLRGHAVSEAGSKLGRVGFASVREDRSCGYCEAMSKTKPGITCSLRIENSQQVSEVQRSRQLSETE